MNRRRLQFRGFARFALLSKELVLGLVRVQLLLVRVLGSVQLRPVPVQEPEPQRQVLE
jgi:hypothetical protein